MAAPWEIQMHAIDNACGFEAAPLDLEGSGSRKETSIIPSFSSSLLTAIALVAILCFGTSAFAQQTLGSVKHRDKLLCGISPIAPGFSYLDDRGSRRGFDVDICRAVAAAVLGDSNKVEWVPLNTNVRFQAIQSGQVDLLSAQTTWTFSRDNSVGLDFGPVVFHDGQSMMVPAAMGVKSIADLAGATICLLSGTTNLQNLEDFFRPRGLKYDPVVFEDSDQWRNAFFAGRCDAASSDSSVLASVRSMSNDPHKYQLLSELISQEPLAPAMRQNDSNWRDIVSWTIFALITAEEKGINQANVDSFTTSSDPEIGRLLGSISSFGKMLGLSNKWAYDVIKAVGNYGEIYERNVGPSSALGIPRGRNKIWIEGGLIYSPPFR
jgi:general L-amino acid transport system substrate-binding protein